MANQKGNDQQKNNRVEEEPEDKTVEFDEILPHIGEFGLYQKILFLMMVPFLFCMAFVYFAQIFLTLVPEEHWCRVEELMNLTAEQR